MFSDAPQPGNRVSLEMPLAPRGKSYGLWKTLEINGKYWSGGARQPAHGMRISCAGRRGAGGILSSVSQSRLPSAKVEEFERNLAKLAEFNENEQN